VIVAVPCLQTVFFFLKVPSGSFFFFLYFFFATVAWYWPAASGAVDPTVQSPSLL
jgi:hypothetical protein